MRPIAALFSALAVLAGSYAGYTLQRTFGPETSAADAAQRGDRGSFFGGGSDAGPKAKRKAIGSFFRAENTKKVLATIREETGRKARIESLTIRADAATVLAKSGGKRVSLLIDPTGEVRRTEMPATGAPMKPVDPSRLDPRAIERMAAAAAKRSKKHKLSTVDYATVSTIGLPGAGQVWIVYFTDGGYYFADLDGGNLRRPGE